MSDRTVYLEVNDGPILVDFVPERQVSVPWCEQHRCTVLPPANRCAYAIGVVKPLRPCDIRDGVVWKKVDDA